jgi:hypothetical protein
MPYNKDGIWEPHEKQAEFIAIPNSIKEAAYLGGAGSAKTETLLVLGVINQWHKNPRFKQVFLRRTYPELKLEVVPRSKELFRPFGAKFNQTDMVWTFESGAIIKLGHCEHEDDVHQYDTMEINLLTMDEITSFTEYMYLYLAFSRVRSSHPELPAIARVAGMPGGIGHTWVKRRWVDPDPKGGKIIVGKGGNKRIFIFATAADNPYVDPKYLQSLEGLPEAERKAKKYGDFNAFMGQVFSEFRDKQYPDEPENALHVIPPFEVPEFWPRIVIGDWGFRAMTWIGHAAISPDRRLYVYREQYWYKTRIEQWAVELKHFVEQENPRMVKFCKSIGQDRGQENTIHKQIEDALGVPVELAVTAPGSRVAGKLLIHEYLRWESKRTYSQDVKAYDHEFAMWLIRNRSLEEYHSYIDSFKKEPEEKNLPKLQIFDTCPILIDAIKACVYAKSKDGVPSEDIAEFDGDDPVDALRYMVDSADRYFVESEDEFLKVIKRQKLIETLEHNQDWTAFYRNSRAMESQGRNLSVKRIHPARRAG